MIEEQQASVGESNDTNASREMTPFPDWVVSGVAEKFAKLYSKYTEFPFTFLYFGFLCCLGSIVAGMLFLKSQIPVTTRFYMIFWVSQGFHGNLLPSTVLWTFPKIFPWVFKHLCWSRFRRRIAARDQGCKRRACFADSG